MLEEDVKKMLKMSSDFWPNSTAGEISLLKKIIQDQPIETTKDIIEDIRIEHRFRTIPLDKIQAALRQHNDKEEKKKQIQVDCWALNELTGKHIEVGLIVNNIEDAEAHLIRYIERWHNSADGYILFIGKDKHFEFMEKRTEIKRMLNSHG